MSTCGVRVAGVAVDANTRCRHYRGPHDVVAIRFKCCGVWYACIHCHSACADHNAAVWTFAERDQPAVFCGVCAATLRIAEYLACDSVCPRCGANFNPGCASHHHFYFEMPSSA